MVFGLPSKQNKILSGSPMSPRKAEKRHLKVDVRYPSESYRKSELGAIAA
jgi:hypothetical protein